MYADYLHQLRNLYYNTYVYLITPSTQTLPSWVCALTTPLNSYSLCLPTPFQNKGNTVRSNTPQVDQLSLFFSSTETLFTIIFVMRIHERTRAHSNHLMHYNTPFGKMSNIVSIINRRPISVLILIGKLWPPIIIRL